MNLENVIAVRPHKTIYRDGAHTIKLFDNDYSKVDVLNEALNQARVEMTGLPTPGVVEVTTIDGKWAIVSNYIEGKTLGKLIEENPDRKDEYIQRLVDIQMEIHNKKAPLLNKLYDKMERKIAMADLSADLRYDLHTRLSGMPRHHKVCHGDFNPSNVIITPEDNAFVIDWSHATQGNSSADVARTYLLFCLTGDTKTADFYLDYFCLKSGIEKTYVQKWLPIVAASQSIKGKPDEREFLMGWANVVDYE